MKLSLTTLSLIWFSLAAFCQTESYIIRKGDIIDIVVMEHPEFSIQGIIVLPDGSIQYPGFGSIKASEMTTARLRDTLELVLNKYVVNPLVTVFIRRLAEQKLNVFGYVNSPGQYQIFDSMDIISAISMAGGIRNVKKLKKIIIIRPDLSVEEVKIKSILGQGGTIDALPRVSAGDTLYLREPSEFNWSKLSFFASLLTATASILNILL